MQGIMHYAALREAREAEERDITPFWRRIGNFTVNRDPAAWERARRTREDLNRDLADAFDSGLTPDSPAANELAERHRNSLDPAGTCTHSMHAAFASMYVQDLHFARQYEAVAPGLAAWLAAAIVANCRRHGVDPFAGRWETAAPPNSSANRT